MFELHEGDCLDILPTLEANSVDSIITDPPYGLSFMSKDWDHGIPGVRFWTECLRVAKPGAMLLAFGGTRTWHRLAVAIEGAGWEIRDTVMWLYGSGFPKSHDISKAIDKAAGAEREVVGDKGTGRVSQTGRNGSHTVRMWGNENGAAPITAPATDAAQQWDGYGTALKPAWEPVIVAMKPRDGTFAENALKWGVAGLWIDGGRVGTSKQVPASPSGTPFAKGACGFKPPDMTSDGWNPNIGRWPANVIHDGSDEVVRGFPNAGGGNGKPIHAGDFGKNGVYGTANGAVTQSYADSGSAARFFYCAKASRSERNAGLEGLPERSHAEVNGRKEGSAGASREYGGGTNPYLSISSPTQNHHPTVKPLELMRYLCRLTKTPTGGVVLDPFCGSGTTGIAAVLEGRDFIGIEQEPEYVEIARRRIEYHAAQPEQLELIDA